MVNIARRNLFAEKGRLIISVGGVAFSVLLISILVGLYQGWTSTVTAYVRSARADLWVRQAGSTDMFHSVSYLSASVGEDLRAIEGVSRVSPLVGRTVKLQLDGKEVMAYLVGYDPQSGVGGPVRMEKGEAAPRPGQIIVDQALAGANGVEVGDRLPVLDTTLEVVGVSGGGNMLLYSFSFINQRDAEQLLGMKGLANYYLLKLSDASQKEAVIRRIHERIPGVEAISTETFAQANRQFVDNTFIPIISVLVAISFAVGVVVIGLTIYTATMEKSREYGVLKALGASNGRLYRIVFEQALTSGVLGYILGAALTAVVASLAQRISPMFVTSLSSSAMLGIFGLTLLMSLAASYVPVNRLVRIDPALVFRS